MRIATTFLLVALSGFMSLQAQNIYVSPTGTGTGDGTLATPIPLSLLNTALGGGKTSATVYFADGTYTMTTATTITVPAALVTARFTRVNDAATPVFDGGLTTANFIVPTNRTAATTLTVDHLTLKRFSSASATGMVFHFGAGNINTSIIVEHSIIEDCVSTVATSGLDYCFRGMFYLNAATSTSGGGKKLIMRHNTIRRCTSTGSLFGSWSDTKPTPPTPLTSTTTWR